MKDVHTNEELHRLVVMLSRSCEAFDWGATDEAIQIANLIAILVHESQTETSLLRRLNANEIAVLSTVRSGVAELSGITNFMGFGMIDPRGVYRATLDMSSTKEMVPLNQWWNQIVFIPGQNRGQFKLTRKAIVLNARDSEGGPDVGSADRDAYAALIENPIGAIPIPIFQYFAANVRDAHLVGLRQFGYEILNSETILKLTSAS